MKERSDGPFISRSTFIKRIIPTAAVALFGGPGLIRLNETTGNRDVVPVTFIDNTRYTIEPDQTALQDVLSSAESALHNIQISGLQNPLTLVFEKGHRPQDAVDNFSYIDNQPNSSNVAYHENTIHVYLQGIMETVKPRETNPTNMEFMRKKLAYYISTTVLWSISQANLGLASAENIAKWYAASNGDKTIIPPLDFGGESVLKRANDHQLLNVPVRLPPVIRMLHNPFTPTV